MSSKQKIFGKFSELIVEAQRAEFIFSGTCEGHVEDQGIGPYEFWGSTGWHHDYVNVIDEWNPETLTIRIDKDNYPDYMIGDDDELYLDYPIDRLKNEQPKLWEEIESKVFEEDLDGIVWDEDDGVYDES